MSNLTKLNLGCGPYPLKGWHNLDMIEHEEVITCDLRKRLPFRDCSVDYIFSEHFIEHLSLPDFQKLMTECFRVLKGGGAAIRLSTPSLEILIKDYQEKTLDRWEPWGWKPGTPCQMVNELMHKWGHQYLFDYQEISLRLKEAGFSEVSIQSHRKSNYVELAGLERRRYLGELIVEAVKH